LFASNQTSNAPSNPSRCLGDKLEFDKSGSLTKFRALLSKLKDPRNKAAHTHKSGVLPTIDAPSVVRKNLEDLYAYLRELERIIKRLRF
jgi:hypothetical protein